MQADEVDVDGDGLAREADLDVVAAPPRGAQAGVDAAPPPERPRRRRSRRPGVTRPRSAASTTSRPSEAAMSSRAPIARACPRPSRAHPARAAPAPLRMPMAPGPTTRAVSPGEATAGSQRHWRTHAERLVQRTGMLADGCRATSWRLRAGHQTCDAKPPFTCEPIERAREAEVAPAGATGITGVAGEEVGLGCDPLAERVPRRPRRPRRPGP